MHAVILHLYPEPYASGYNEAVNNTSMLLSSLLYELFAKGTDWLDCIFCMADKHLQVLCSICVHSWILGLDGKARQGKARQQGRQEDRKA